MADLNVYMATGLSLDQMRMLLRKGLAATPEDMDNDFVDLLLNMSYWEIEKKYPFKEKECRIEFPCTIGENIYRLPDEDDLIQLEALQAVSILDLNNVNHPLERMTQSWWDTEYSHAKGSSFFALPQYYLRMDESLVVHPTPDQIYTIRVYFLKTLKTLLDEAFEQPDLPRNWHELIVEGAVSRGLFYKQDISMSQQVHALQTSKIRSAVPIEGKEERDSHYAGVEVLWEWPSDL